MKKYLELMKQANTLQMETKEYSERRKRESVTKMFKNNKERDT